MKRVPFARALFPDQEDRRVWLKAQTLRNNQDLAKLCKRLELLKAPVLKENIDLTNLSTQDENASWALVGKALGYLEPEISGLPIPTPGRPRKKPEDMWDRKRAKIILAVANIAKDKGCPPRSKRSWIESGKRYYRGRHQDLFKSDLRTLENSVSRGLNLLEFDPGLFTNKG